MTHNGHGVIVPCTSTNLKDSERRASMSDMERNNYYLADKTSTERERERTDVALSMRKVANVS